MAAPIEHIEIPVRTGHLGIGRGVPSGKDEDHWRIMNIQVYFEEHPARAWYSAGRIFDIRCYEDWELLPEHGLLMLACMGGKWKGCDEYWHWGSQAKFGEYVPEDEWLSVVTQAEEHIKWRS